MSFIVKKIARRGEMGENPTGAPVRRDNKESKKSPEKTGEKEREQSGRKRVKVPNN
jgi:hypothetical protein